MAAKHRPLSETQSFVTAEQRWVEQLKSILKKTCSYFSEVKTQPDIKVVNKHLEPLEPKHHVVYVNQLKFNYQDFHERVPNDKHYNFPEGLGYSEIN